MKEVSVFFGPERRRRRSKKKIAQHEGHYHRFEQCRTGYIMPQNMANEKSVDADPPTRKEGVRRFYFPCFMPHCVSPSNSQPSGSRDFLRPRRVSHTHADFTKKKKGVKKRASAERGGLYHRTSTDCIKKENRNVDVEDAEDTDGQSNLEHISLQRYQRRPIIAHHLLSKERDRPEH